MSPLDDELRRALRDRAGAVTLAGDPMPGIESRVRGLRRRRRSAVAVTAAAAVGALALAVPLPVGLPSWPGGLGDSATATSGEAAGGLAGPELRPTVPGDPRADAGDARADSGATTGRGEPTVPAVPAGAVAWPPRGAPLPGLADRAVAAVADSARVESTALTSRSLWGGRTGGGDEVLVAQAWAPGRPAVWTAVAVRRGASVTLVRVTESAAAPDVVEATLPAAGGEPPRLVVVAEPGAQRLDYAADGRSFRPAEPVPGADGVWELGRPAVSGDLLRVVLADGTVRQVQPEPTAR